MGQGPEGKRRAPERGDAHQSAAPAAVAGMWSAASAAHTVLGRRRLYYLASDVEERVAEQLSLIPLLQDWVPVTPYEATELTKALRAYAGRDEDAPRDREAAALSTCIRAMTMTRARSEIPFPPEAEDDLGNALIS